MPPERGSRLKHVPRTGLATLILLALTLSAAARADWTTVEDAWYELTIDDVKAGWMHTSVDRSGEGTADDRFRTEVETWFRLARGGALVTARTAWSFIDDASGKPLECTLRQELSQQVIDTHWSFQSEGVEVTKKQGKRVTTKRYMTPPGTWLTPRMADAFARKRRASGVESFEYRTLDPESGLQPVAVRVRRVEETTHDVDGRVIPVTVWEAASDSSPDAAREHYTSDGHMLEQHVDARLGAVVMRLTDEAAARRMTGRDAPEIFVDSLINIDRRLEAVDGTSVMRYRLRTKTGAMPRLPDAGAQRVVADAEGGASVVTVDIGVPSEASDEEVADTAYREASLLVTSDDALVKKLARRGARFGEAGTLERAEAQRLVVAAHITRKSLATAFATAAETARTRQGDCSEHAVLLAAMLRADGIPSRLASGLVYVPRFRDRYNVFGWHMWTQALIEGRWIDLDATLPQRYHAGHLLTGVSAGSDGRRGEDTLTMLQLIGNLEIDVLEVEHAEDPLRVTPLRRGTGGRPR